MDIQSHLKYSHVKIGNEGKLSKLVSKDVVYVEALYRHLYVCEVYKSYENFGW